MRLRLTITLVVAAAALPAAAEASSSKVAAAPRVPVLVVGRDGAVMAGPKSVRASATTVAIGSKRCGTATGTPLAALAALRRAHGPAYKVRDDAGGCTRSVRDGAGLYVTSIGGQRAAGSEGWVYKVNRRAGTASAGDPSGPFGTGRRLRSGQELLWFWCRQDARAACQPTVEPSATSRTVAPGAPVTITVRAYDDEGHGTPLAGATVRLGGATGTSGADGRVTLPAPAASGRHRVSASKAGTTPGFPAEVRVG
jgi:hypothetical protein